MEVQKCPNIVVRDLDLDQEKVVKVWMSGDFNEHADTKANDIRGDHECSCEIT